MSASTFISRFSPNRTDPRILEAIFVQRHRLAEVWLDRLRESVLTGTKHHLLAIGPRGCGKSHLVNLLVHRLQQDQAINERVRLARLPEDEATPSFWKFLLRILRALGTEYPGEFPPPPRGELEDASAERRGTVLGAYLLEKLGTRTLLVVVENLDDVMRGLGDEGQKRWRAFLQENPVSATLATAQQLTDDVSDRDRPFFNFFQIEHLQPLSVDEALSLLRKIAEHTSNADLVRFLDSPTGRVRVRAIRHVAGGSHRVFIILSEFASRVNLDDLVTAFEQLVDELTPFYQERLRWLPDQQREIVEFLCRQNRTVQVRGIAAELFLTDQTAAAQLRSLKEKGYVRTETVGRESRYELSEPLMRLCIEVKDPRREPIRLIVEFLRIWYDRPGVEARLQGLPPDADMERRYFQAALKEEGVADPVAAALDRDLAVARQSGDREEIVRVLMEAAGTDGSVARVCEFGAELNQLGRTREALDAFQRAIALDPVGAWARDKRIRILDHLGRYHEALAESDELIQVAPGDVSNWNNRGVLLARLGRYAEALASHEQAIARSPNWAIAWANKAGSLIELGRFEEAVTACERGIELDPSYAYAFANRGQAFLGLARAEEAASDLARAIALEPQFAGAHEGLAAVHVLRGDWEAAEKVLLARLQLPASEHNPLRSWHLPDVIVAVFRSSTEPGIWRHRVGRLATLASNAGALGQLADSLVRSLTRKAYAEAPAATLAAWVGVWAEVAEKQPDLSLAVRMFGVGIRYVQTRDERVLFDLVLEERAILRDLFGLAGPQD